MRKLASIQKISDIRPIVGADNIEQATVMGWNVVVRRKEFRVGDDCVFFEIDSILPSTAGWARFMEQRKFRVKTVKLRGCLSQGLALPIATVFHGGDERHVFNVGDDVTDVLGVIKYEPEIQASGSNVVGSFPADIPKTDEIRLQSALGVLDELKGVPFYITVKLDGMSGTFIRRQDGLDICTRNRLIDGSAACAHTFVANKYKLHELPVGCVIQGEVVGPGIQKNRLKLDQYDLYVFNVYDINTRRYLDFDEFILFCFKHKLKTVPVEYEIDEEDVKSFPMTLETFLRLADGEYPMTGNVREGIVVRPMHERHSDVLGGRLSFKCINNRFLLTEEE